MRTASTLWAAALVVVSLTGPFTTAEAAPARPSNPERQPRPVFRKRSFNETDANLELRNPHPQLLGLSIPPVLPGSSSSSVPPGPTDPAHHKHGKAAKHDHISAGGGLLSSGLAPSSSDGGGLLGGLTTLLDGTPTVLGTNGVPLTTALGGLTSDVHSVVSKLTGTGGAGSLVSDVTHAVPTGVVTPLVSEVTHGVASLTTNLPPGITGLTTGLGLTGTGGIVPQIVTGAAGPLLASVQSEASAAVSSLEAATTLLPAQITASIASLESSLESKLSQMSLTATNPALVSALSSGFSSILSGVGSTLGPLTSQVGHLLPTVTGPLGSVLSNPTSALGSVLSNPTSALGSVLSNPTSALGSVLSNPTSALGSIVNPLTSGVIPPIVSSLTGTGGLSIPSSILPTPSGGLTITGPGTTVIVPIPTITPGTSVDTTGTGATTTPQGTGVPISPSGSPSINTSPSTVTTNETVATHSNTPVPTATSNQSPTTIHTTDATKISPEVSIKPTGTDTRTAVSLPTVWTFAPTSGATTVHTVSSLQTAASATQSSSAGLATFLPKLVSPANGMPDPGPNFTLIQVGFKFGLNYPFVVGQPESSMQIMAYLPKGIADGLGIEEDQVMMNALMPFDTASKLGYVTTLAQAYVPRDIVNQLQLSIHTSSSPIYYNQKPAIQQLMRMINPTIPILPGSSYDGLGPQAGFDGKAAAGAGPGSGQGAPIGSDAGTTNKVQSSSVGIAGAAVAGAAVYVASMMYIARRYRQRRKRHQRASSVPTAGEMTQRSSGGMGSLFMAGANGRASTGGSMTIPGGRTSRTSNGSSNGRSIREQGISAPLMSENSLGWN